MVFRGSKPTSHHRLNATGSRLDRSGSRLIAVGTAPGIAAEQPNPLQLKIAGIESADWNTVDLPIDTHALRQLPMISSAYETSVSPVAGGALVSVTPRVGVDVVEVASAMVLHCRRSSISQPPGSRCSTANVRACRCRDKTCLRRRPARPRSARGPSWVFRPRQRPRWPLRKPRSSCSRTTARCRASTRRCPVRCSRRTTAPRRPTSSIRRGSRRSSTLRSRRIDM